MDEMEDAAKIFSAGMADRVSGCFSFAQGADSRLSQWLRSLFCSTMFIIAFTCGRNAMVRTGDAGGRPP